MENMHSIRELANALRWNPTRAEMRLWYRIRDKQILDGELLVT